MKGTGPSRALITRFEAQYGVEPCRVPCALITNLAAGQSWRHMAYVAMHICYHDRPGAHWRPVHGRCVVHAEGGYMCAEGMCKGVLGCRIGSRSLFFHTQ